MMLNEIMSAQSLEEQPNNHYARIMTCVSNFTNLLIFTIFKMLQLSFHSLFFIALFFVFLHFPFSLLSFQSSTIIPVLFIIQ